MNINSIHIDRYGPLSNVSITPVPGITVVAGPNEAGKTLLLEAILQLLEPNAAFPGIERVEGAPAGEVVVTYRDDQHAFRGSEAMSDVSPLEPRHLRNSFVVRDGDLAITDEHAYYDRLTDRLADIHTGEIEAIIDRLRSAGRLTPTELRLSDASEYDHANSVRTDARRIAEDIRAYLDSATESELADLERKAVAASLKRDRLETDLEAQQAAKDAATVDQLRSALETVRTTTAELETLPTRQAFETAAELDRRRSTAADRLEQARERRTSLTSRLDALERDRRELVARRSELADRSRTIENLQDDLETVRSLTTSTPRTAHAGLLAVLGVAGAGLAVLGQALVVAILLAVVGFGAAAWYAWCLMRERQLDQRRRLLLNEARDVGLSVERVEDVGLAISSFTEEIKTVRHECEAVEREIAVTADRIDDVDETIETARSTVEECETALRDNLAEYDVADIDALRQAVERAEDSDRDRAVAVDRLRKEFGEPDTSETERIDYWESQIDDRASHVSADADSNRFDRDRLDRLETELHDVREQLSEIEEAQREHQTRIEHFADRIDALDVEPFDTESITLPARSIAGLRSAAAALEDLVDSIDWAADRARDAIAVFESIAAREERKLESLFGPDSPTSDHFRHITDGRYESVTYESGERTLLLHRSSGEIHEVATVSRGTRDQLYFATRVGLGEQLLTTEPGLFLLDDPFLSADPDRLTNGFETLGSLVDAGWQILYLTAKAEVRDLASDRDEAALVRLHSGDDT